LPVILNLGSGYWDLLRYIQTVFLSEDGRSLSSESVEIPTESFGNVLPNRLLLHLASSIRGFFLNQSDTPLSNGSHIHLQTF
jgi:hypothetical protein